mgnify:CR=1 FL=1
MLMNLMVHQVRVNFCIGSGVLTGEPPVRPRCPQLEREYMTERMLDMQEALRLIPEQHLALLSSVPIVFNVGPGRGGWCAPGRQSRPWLGAERFGVDGAELSGLPHTNGLILISTRVLEERPAPGRVEPCKLAVLHETGHCVDHHLSLASNLGGTAHRNGNLPYQGQRYTRNGVTKYYQGEFRAETYSRVFLVPDRICVRQRAEPPCESHPNHSGCNARLQTDLASTRAFRMLGGAMSRYLPRARVSPQAGSEDTARGPVGAGPVTERANSQLSPRVAGSPPGPAGIA